MIEKKALGMDCEEKKRSDKAMRTKGSRAIVQKLGTCAEWHDCAAK